MLPESDTEILFDDNKKDINKQEILNIFHQYKEKHNNFEFIYTDGSKSEKTGAAFYHKRLLPVMKRACSSAVKRSDPEDAGGLPAPA